MEQLRILKILEKGLLKFNVSVCRCGNLFETGTVCECGLSELASEYEKLKTELAMYLADDESGEKRNLTLIKKLKHFMNIFERDYQQ